ncbi:MAG: hypothetical protein P8N40_04570 [Gammaproteobacteria bacterium]|nr:hypothetical protein [Gammaproteobacteria bacterium]
MIDYLSAFSSSTGIYTIMNTPWGWPIVESMHFLGLSLLIGTVGIFDLRLLGIGQGIAYSDLHKLVKIGVIGYAINVTTGVMFLTTAPDQYIYNPAFQTKILFMFIAGLNMVWFYQTTSAQVKKTAALDNVTNRAKMIGGISLLCWIIVIVCGRLITYFRPPYHWCWFC